MEAVIYNQKGEKAGKVTLPESVFGLPWNGDLVHQVMTSMQSNKRAGTAHTKDRSEVSGGGRKPWRQKGTGRARHGSIRSPIWRGGGVTHGPTKEKNYNKKINKKMKTKALFTVLSEKQRSGEILFVDKIELSDAKTKKAREVLASLSKISGFDRLVGGKKKVIHLAEYKVGEDKKRSFRNLPQISMGEIRNLNTIDVLQYKYLIVTEPKKSLKLIEERLKKESSEK